jgi:hypothetical protein
MAIPYSHLPLRVTYSVCRRFAECWSFHYYFMWKSDQRENRIFKVSCIQLTWKTLLPDFWHNANDHKLTSMCQTERMEERNSCVDWIYGGKEGLYTWWQGMLAVRVIPRLQSVWHDGNRISSAWLLCSNNYSHLRPTRNAGCRWPQGKGREAAPTFVQNSHAIKSEFLYYWICIPNSIITHTRSCRLVQSTFSND